MLFKKFLLAASITTGLALCSSVLTFADVTVKIGNDTLQTDQPPVIVEGRTLVPFRAIYEGLGAEVEWNESTREATGKRGQTTVTMTIDKPEMVVNGETIALDVPAKIINDRTMVPVRAVSDGLDETVDWDPISKTVKITTSYVGLNTDPEENARIHPGWLDEANLYYRIGLNEYKDPINIYGQSYQLDENGNVTWNNDEYSSLVSLLTAITDVIEGQEAKNIAIAQGVLDADKLEKKVKDTFGSAKWVAIRTTVAANNDTFIGRYMYMWSYEDADCDPRNDKGKIGGLEENGISYLTDYRLVYDNKLYDLAFSRKTDETPNALIGEAVFCLPEDYDNLLMRNVALTESTFNDKAALIADMLATSTVDEFKNLMNYNNRAAIFLPLKPYVEPEF